MSNLEEADVVVDVGGVVVLVADDLGDVDSLLDAFTDIKLRYISPNIYYCDCSKKLDHFTYSDTYFHYETD